MDIGINNIMPERSIRIYPKDCPWMSVRLKKSLNACANKPSIPTGMAWHISSIETLLTKKGNYAKGNTTLPKSKILKA